MTDGSPPIIVLLGGPSAEHDVSIVSGTAIAEALAGGGSRVEQVLITLDGGWWWLPADHRRNGRAASAYDDPAALGGRGPLSVGAALDRLTTADPAPIVFIALHGPFGEDGTVQALLETVGIAYVGSGVTASAIGMDKAMQKRLWRGLGLPVVDWREIRIARWRATPALVLAELEAFATGGDDPRLMIKPSHLGSSVGMTLSRGPDDRAAALETAFRFDRLVLAERYLVGARDLEVAIIGNEPAEIELYGPGEIVAGHEFYDYEAKYTPGLSTTMAVASIPEPTRLTVLKLARDAYRAVGAEGFARIDFLLAGSAIHLSEINTIPGFTPISLFPVMAAAGGYDFAGVCRRIVDLAIERHAAGVDRRVRTDDLPR